MAGRFEGLKSDSGSNAFGQDRREGSGAPGAFGSRPFAKRGGNDNAEMPGKPADSGVPAGERRQFAAFGDRDSRQERQGSSAFGGMSKDRGERGQKDGGEQPRTGNFASFSSGNKRDENREAPADAVPADQRRTFDLGPVGSSAEQSAPVASSDPNNRFARFAQEEKANAPPPAGPVVDEASKARFGKLMEDSGRDAGASSGPSVSAVAARPFAAAAAAGANDFAPAFSRPFAVRKDGTGAAEAPAAFTNSRRSGPSDGGAMGGRDAPAAFQGMRRAGQDGATGGGPGGMDRDRGGRQGGDFGGGAFGGQGNRQMPDAFTQGRRPGETGRDRARQDAVAMGGAATVQDRYKVNIISLVGKEDQKPSTTAASSGGNAASSPVVKAPAAASAASTAALAKVSSMGDGAEALVRGTFARAAQGRLDDYLTDLSKEAAKKAAIDLGKLTQAKKDVLTPYAAELVAKKCLQVEASGERKALGALLNALRTAFSKKEPALCTDEQVAIAIESALETLPAGEEGFDARVSYFIVLEAVLSAKGAMPAAALGPHAQALLHEKPTHAKAADEEDGSDALAGMTMADGSVSWGDAAVPPVAAAASSGSASSTGPTGGGTPGKAPVDSQADADKVAEEFVNCGKLGADLLAAAAEELVGFNKVEIAAATMTACLKAAQGKGWLNSKCTWLGKDKFRPLLSSQLHGKTKASVAALFRLQSFFNDIDFPMGDKNVPVLLRVFEALYQEDVVEEEPMQEWRNDMRNHTAGHDKALMQLEEFFDWMDNAEEEDEDEEEDDELEGIVRPNNRGQLR